MDKYRSLAAYYMICRLIIILIIIVNRSNNNTVWVLIIIASTILTLVLKPYNSKTLNCFDCFILQLMTLLLTVPLFYAIDQKLLVTFISTVIVLPLVAFTGMEIAINENALEKLILCCSAKPKLYRR